jgi:nucleotide-binding universal stress UspA family protein
MADPTILVPVDVSTDERPPPQLLELFHPVTVVLVGWYPVPDQTPLEQMRDEHEQEAIDFVEAIAAEFPDDGADVETLVVFTRDRADTVDRVADDYDCDAVLIPEDVRTVERVLVPIRGDQNLEAILSFVSGLLDESEASVTLFHATDTDEEDPGAADVLLRGGADELVEGGVDADRIETVNVETGTPVEDIVDAAQNHDVLVIGETDPSLVEHILGDVPSRIIERSSRPVLVVRDVEGS